MRNDNLEQLKNIFKQNFKHEPTIFSYAPGRVNIIGEHTDYNGGFVMPCAIDYGCLCLCRLRDDHKFNVFACDLDEHDSFNLVEEVQISQVKWTNYVRGVVHFIQQKFPNATQGADILISSNVPLGSGLSSSAALEIAVAFLFREINNLTLTNLELALIGQQAENNYAGCNCGNMDQIASACGVRDNLLLIDCKELITTTVKVPENLAVVIINSNIKHDLVDGEYNKRREQCEQAAAFFQAPDLRSVTFQQFSEKEQKLVAVDPDIAKRARHIISENDRVLAAKKALDQGDLAALGELMYASHQSMKNDFEITIEPIDYLVDLIYPQIKGHGGVRMTGGGFGGCVVALVEQGKVELIRSLVAENYIKHTGIAESFYVTKAADGAKILC